MSETRASTDRFGYVLLRTEDGERRFWCAESGGYVYEFVNGEWKQVCEGLSRYGATLECSSQAKLLDKIHQH